MDKLNVQNSLSEQNNLTLQESFNEQNDFSVNSSSMVQYNPSMQNSLSMTQYNPGMQNSHAMMQGSPNMRNNLGLMQDSPGMQNNLSMVQKNPSVQNNPSMVQNSSSMQNNTSMQIVAPERKRASYTAEFKLFVVTKAEQLGNREAGRLFHIDEKNIRMWRKCKESLSRSEKHRRANRGRIPHWPQLEDSLYEWLLKQRDSRTALNITDILACAGLLADAMGLKDFGCRKGWCHRFLKRKNLRICDGMIYDESLPSDWEAKAHTFLQIVEECSKKSNCDLRDVIVMDEIYINFDPSKDSISTNSAIFKSKFSFRAVVACSADGSKLKPLIIFRTKDNPFGEDFPDGVEVEASEKGCLDASVMSEWINLVWKQRNENQSSKGVLIIDSTKAHILSDLKSVCESASAEVLVIPEGMTTKLQPFDFGITKNFEAAVKFFWRKQNWERLRLCSTLNLDRPCDPALLEVAEWVKEAWSRISSRKIRRAFVDSGIVKAAHTVQTGDTESSCTQTKKSKPSDESHYVQEMFSSDSEDFDFDSYLSF